MRCDRIFNRPLPAKEKKAMKQEEFNVALRESTHFKKFRQWKGIDRKIEAVKSYFITNVTKEKEFLNLDFNSQQGYLLAYLREERNIGIKMEIFTDGECGLVYRANLFVFTDCRFNRIPNRNISNSDYNELMKELILIAMNHDS